MGSKKLVVIVISIIAVVSVCTIIGTIFKVISTLPNLFDFVGNTLMFLIGTPIALLTGLLFVLLLIIKSYTE